jgi:hypothetical protein
VIKLSRSELEHDYDVFNRRRSRKRIATLGLK